MIDHWLELARGPIFYMAVTLMILGLIRHIVLTFLGICRMVSRAGHPTLPYGQIFKATLVWLFPFSRMNQRVLYSLLSVIFHIGLIATPIFLSAHILLLERGTGLVWPALSRNAADWLTVITILTGIGLILGRISNRHSRAISRFQDFFLPVFLAAVFLSGFLAGRPQINPISYNAMMLIHIMCGNIVFLMLPFTKLAHAVLLPTAQLVSEAAWHFPAGSGVDVAEALHKEAQEV